MEHGEKMWPRRRWELTAPESYVLIYGPKAGEGQPFKLALLELVADGHLILTEAEGSVLFGLRRKSAALLTPGPERRPPRSRSLSALLDLLGGMPAVTTRDGQTGVPVMKLAHEARRKYRWLAGYAVSEVAPALESRGLFERRERPVLGLFGTPRWEVTRAGRDARDALERRLDLGEDHFASWVDKDPARALAFLGIAGSSVLLMRGIHPHIRRLREQHDPAAGPALLPAHGGLLDDATDAEAGYAPVAPDLAGPDLPISDLSVFDGLDAVFSSVDFNVDAGAGGAGGGDGGGGS